jgi:starch phosphorylase
VDDLMALGGKPDGYFSTTKLLTSLGNHQSGVSEIHVREEKVAHPESKLIATTNGIYGRRWRAANLELAPRQLANDELNRLHGENRQVLLNYVEEQTGTKLTPDRLTVVWARRMTAYKRPEFIISDLARLATLIHHETRPVQFIVAGTANPADAVGMDLVNRIISASNNDELKTGLAYVPRYNPMAARILVQGADVWLNTPIRGMEACGTSGMKASLNGALQFSTSDGWVDEIDLEAIGWELAEKAVPSDLYDVLEQHIAPLFYDEHAGWIAKMSANIELIEQQFTATTMLKNYYEKLYT